MKKWIDIKKIVPPGTGSLDDDRVLITDGDSIASADWMGDCFEEIQILNNFMYDNIYRGINYIDIENEKHPKITHWMELPEPPLKKGKTK